MSTTLLLCTANTDPKVIEKLITESSRPRSAPPYQFVLVRSPSEPIKGPQLTRAHKLWPEKYPEVEDSPAIEPFETGFHDTSFDKLQDFIRRHKVDKSADFETTNHQFAVLDTRSARDGTILIYQHHSRMPKEALLEDEDAWDEEKLIHEWVEWRVKFLISGFWTATYDVGPDYADFEIKKDQYIDKNGVLQLPWMDHDEVEVPGYSDDDKAPYGPDVKEPEWKYPESPFVELVEKGVIKTYPVDWQ